MGRKRNKNSPEPGPSSRATSDTGNDKEVKRKRMDQELVQSDSAIPESEEHSVTDDDLQQPAAGPDWRQLPEVIEEICKHLPCDDIKSVRLVCKVWSEAGAVPLSYKSIYNFNGVKKDYRTSFMKARSCMALLGNNELSPGFRLRNLELDWFIQKKFYGYTPPEPRLEVWLNFLKSEHIQDVVCLKLKNFPYRVLDELLLTKSFFPKLKTLELHSVRYSVPVLIPADALGGSCDSLELKSVGIYDWMPQKHGWNFLHNCNKLTELKIEITEDGDSYAKDDTRYRCHMEKFANALKGKKLTTLDLKYTSNLSNDAISSNLSIWSTFCNQLISGNPRLERLHLAVEGYLVHVSDCFNEVPLPLENLKTFDCVFKAYTRRDENRSSGITSFEELFKKFESKGYLKVENFHLSNCDQSPSLSVSCVKRKLRMITSPKLNYKFTQSFLDMMYNLFPEVNYVCSPRQNKVGNQSPITTALLERLGRDGVFNLEAVTDDWDNDNMKPPKNSRFHRQDLLKHYRLVVHDPEVISSNLMSNRFDWKMGEEVKAYNGILYMFDTIPDIHEAWAKVQNSTSYWSSVPDGFVPAMVHDGRASAYSLCRMFKEIQDIRPPRETILTRSKALKQ